MKYVISFTPQELQLLAGALSELPYKISAALIANIQGQVSAIEGAAKERAPPADPAEQ